MFSCRHKPVEHQRRKKTNTNTFIFSWLTQTIRVPKDPKSKANEFDFISTFLEHGLGDREMLCWIPEKNQGWSELIVVSMLDAKEPE